MNQRIHACHRKIVTIARRVLRVSLAGGLMLSSVPASADSTHYFINGDGTGSETIVLSGAQSQDPDGAIIDYIWRVNDAVADGGFGPRVGDLTHVFALGTSTVTLTVRDDAHATDTATARVVLLPASQNQPPVAQADVPAEVMADLDEVALVSVDASASSDPDGDPIVRYRWTKDGAVLYDGSSPTADLTLSGLGAHTINLQVTSRDSLSILQSDSRDFAITLVPFRVELAGREFSRIEGKDFAFSDTHGRYSGITYNPLTETFFMTDSRDDVVLEINANGDLLRTINGGALKPDSHQPDENADMEGIVWMYGTTFAIVLQDSRELVIANIDAGTSQLARADVETYDLFGDPKGVVYNAADDTLWWVSQRNPKRIMQSRPNRQTGQIDLLAEFDVDTIPVERLSDITYFPRLSPHLFVISEDAQLILEVDMTVTPPAVVSSLNLGHWPIPRANGLAFDRDGRLYVIGKRVAGEPEDDFTVFAPVLPIANLPPVAQIDGPAGDAL